MGFWEFTVCMYCVLSSGDTSRFVVDNKLAHLPLNGIVRGAFFVLTIPAMIGVFALPIYGFVVMPWWQPIVGIIVASIFGNVFTRQMLAGSSWLYLWAIGFSLAGVTLFAYFQFA
jgi:hypothetical protein